MKHRLNRLLWVLVVLLFVACQHHDQYVSLQRVLDELDSVCYVQPKDAITRLEGIRSQAEGASEDMYRRWQLLYIKAHDKADDVICSDSLIHEVVSYYNQYGTPSEQVEAYYYLGRTYYACLDMPDSAAYYYDAAFHRIQQEHSEKENRDFEAEREALQRAYHIVRMAVLFALLVLLCALAVGYLYKRSKAKIEKQLAAEREKVQALSDKASKLKDQLSRLEHAQEKDEILQLFKQHTTDLDHSMIKDSDWDRLTILVDNLYPGFSQSLTGRCPEIKVFDKRIATLLKLGFTKVDIERIMQLKRTTAHRHIRTIKGYFSELQ